MSIGRRLPRGLWLAGGAPAFACEGSRTAAGRGESAWDRFLRPWNVAGEDMDARGSDSYARFRDDVRLAASLGLDRLAFSIAWTRILPDGAGKVEQRGLDHYDRLVEAVLEAGLLPLPILHHWDVPQRVVERGGLGSPDAPRLLGGLAETVARRLADRLDIVLTVAEPQVQAFRGHVDGSHAPGLRGDWRAAVAVADGLLRGHAAMAAALRATRSGLRVGALLDRRTVEPASDRSGDVDAAARVDAWANALFLDPLLGRGYPPAAVETLDPLLDPLVVEAMAGIPADLDLLGVRVHRDERIVAGRGAPLDAAFDGAPAPPVGRAATARALAALAAAAPGVPLVVVGSELPGADPAPVAGRIDDVERTGALLACLEGVADAAEAGVPVLGHVAWPLLDGFAWERGDAVRLGLVRHDHDGARTIRASGEAYAAVARAVREAR